jgi:hypothetical protein
MPLLMQLTAFCAQTPWQTPWQAPPTHVWLVQATAPCHWPSLPHTCVALPEHFAVPGTHTPPHAEGEPVQAYWHALGAPQLPVPSHVSRELA